MGRRPVVFRASALVALAILSSQLHAGGGSFSATGEGPIPDGVNSMGHLCGDDLNGTSPRVLSFLVSGMTENVEDVQVRVQLQHGWRGDLGLVLAAPNTGALEEGAGASFLLAKWIGSTSAYSCGSGNDFNGFYTFEDHWFWNPWWDANPITNPGDYRTTESGGAGQTDPAPATDMDAAFAGLTPAQTNGIWTLTITDYGPGVTGTAYSARLYINPIFRDDFEMRLTCRWSATVGSTSLCA